ncbi:MAG: hypothetical protein Q9216_001076 [Gyalolechia sp. 2 TL-2023]
MGIAIVLGAAGIVGADGLCWLLSSSLPSSSSSPLREPPFNNAFVTRLVLTYHSCVTARRRRRHGMTPYRGTGWAAGRTPADHAPAQYTGAQPYYGGGNQYNNNQPTGQAVYSPPPNQNYYGNQGANQSYFGGQQSGVELQSPNNTYQPPRGGDQVYSPPTGPPPGKDGIVR